MDSDYILKRLHELIMQSATKLVKYSHSEDYWQGQFSAFVNSWYIVAMETMARQEAETIWDEYHALVYPANN